MIRRVIIDHVEFIVSDLAASMKFYSTALAPLGFQLLSSRSDIASFGIERLDDFTIKQGDPPSARTHIAFISPSKEAVDEFFRNALSAGGRVKSAPALRPQYHAEYYAAYVFDPDGNDIEAVNHGSEIFPGSPNH